MTKGKNVYFISDLHLGATYFADPIAKERRVTRWLESVRDDAAHIYLLGDILDYWYEYRYVVPRGYTRFLGKVAEMADSGIKFTWFVGNHDIWIFDYLPNELGIEVIDGAVERDILGKHFFLAHGDGIGRHRKSFRMIRAIFRNHFCQRLFSAIHPRWTVPFAHRWSTSNRKNTQKMQSDFEKARKVILSFSEQYYSEHPEIDYFVYGHLHSLEDVAISETARVIILGDWISKDSFARFDGEQLTLHNFPQ